MRAADVALSRLVLGQQHNNLGMRQGEENDDGD